MMALDPPHPASPLTPIRRYRYEPGKRYVEQNCAVTTFNRTLSPTHTNPSALLYNILDGVAVVSAFTVPSLLSRSRSAMEIDAAGEDSRSLTSSSE